VYSLKKKNEQFEKFKEFQKYCELLSNKKIKELRTDNGKEYLSNEFIQYLKNAGIKHNTSPEYCPESNGKAERLNRTIITKARCMMISLNVSLHLWTAAVDTANYIRNRSPSTVLNGQTPYEALFKKLPNINHLKIFGCAAYPLNNDKQRDKFHPTAFKNCIMAGYGETEGIYWIYNKETKKMFRSRDVKFNENTILECLNENVIDMSEFISNNESIKKKTKS
jgi:hypothetical protein